MNEIVFESNAHIPKDIHLINYGVLLDQDVLFSSNEDFEKLLQVVLFSNSFATNIKDGRLHSIRHDHDGKSFTTMIHNRVIPGNDDENMLMYVISGNDEILPPEFQQQILDNFYKEIEAEIQVKRIRKIYDEKFSDFILKMNRIADKIDQGLSLINEMEEEENSFLMMEREEVVTRIHYIGLSTMGVPVRNRIYDKDLTSLFKLPAKENTTPEDVLRSLMSAQFSAILNSALIRAGTKINDITILYSTLDSLEERKLMVAFYPIGYQDQYTLEICYEGDRASIDGFRQACNHMFTKYLMVPFRGNLKDFELVADVLTSLPANFDLFEKEEVPEQTDAIYEAAALDLDVGLHQDENGEEEEVDPWLEGELDYEDAVEPEKNPISHPGGEPEREEIGRNESVVATPTRAVALFLKDVNHEPDETRSHLEGDGQERDQAESDENRENMEDTRDDIDDEYEERD